MKQAEVLIVGGGPAGAACALRLRQHGLDCLVLDAQPFPRFKPCAGWLTPEIFTDLGITPADYPHGLTTFRSFSISIRGVRFGLPVLQYAIRRVEFDAWLLEHSGAAVETHTVKQIEPVDGGYVIDGQYAGKYLVGAGGTRCPVQRALFEPHHPRPQARLIAAMEEEFAYPDADPTCRLWFFQNGLPGYAWYVPKTCGYVNVGIGGMASRLKQRGETLKMHWTRLLEELARKGLVQGHTYNPVGHAYYLRARAAQARQGNAFVIGDAAGLASADMGEGIRPAVMSGLLAADAIASGEDLRFDSIPRVSWQSMLRSCFAGVDR